MEDAAGFAGKDYLIAHGTHDGNKSVIAFCLYTVDVR